MVVGGLGDPGAVRTVDLISLDPVNHPVPDCLKKLGDFPERMYGGGGAALKDGKYIACNF